MPTGVVRLRLSRDVIKKLFRVKGIARSKGIEEVFDKYCEKVEEDVLEEFLKERR
jgi:hypothetical protein